MRIAVFVLFAACGYREPRASTDGGDDALPDGAPGMPASCRDLTGASGVHSIDPGGGRFDVYCDLQSDGGGWTLVGSFVNTDGARGWSTLAAFTGAPELGSLATRDTADHKSRAWSTVRANDLLVVTDEYAFAFHGLLGGHNAAGFVQTTWPGACNRTWLRQGADYAVGLTAAQASTLGVILDGNDENDARCFPQGDEINALAFMAGDWQNNGLGDAPVTSSDWGLLDTSLPNLANFFVDPCTPGGYPCNAQGVKVRWTDYGAAVKVARAFAFVR